MYVSQEEIIWELLYNIRDSWARGEISLEVAEQNIAEIANAGYCSVEQYKRDLGLPTRPFWCSVDRS